MGKFSREKGKRGERLFVSLCKENGFDGVSRSVQYCGKTGDATMMMVAGGATGAFVLWLSYLITKRWDGDND